MVHNYHLTLTTFSTFWSIRLPFVLTHSLKYFKHYHWTPFLLLKVIQCGLPSPIVVDMSETMDKHILSLTSIFFETTFFTTAANRSEASFPLAIIWKIKNYTESPKIWILVHQLSLISVFLYSVATNCLVYFLTDALEVIKTNLSVVPTSLLSTWLLFTFKM